ncbi:MAG: hypothetical protein ACLGG2_07145 [Gammaproteobacteria bacterium]
MKTQSLTLLALFALVLPAAGAQAGEPADAFERRVALALTPTERAILLEEMHAFLAGVQKLTDALGRQDFPAAAQAARVLGPAMAHEVPATMRAKLPPEFRQLGASTHADFAQIAMDAESLGDVSHSLGQLSATLQKCVACHTTYQVRAAPAAVRR